MVYETSFNSHAYYRTQNYLNQKNDPHACIFVGWNDTISKKAYENRYPEGDLEEAEEDGGWIVKNSWGTQYTDDGYFYLSYDSDFWHPFAVDLIPNDDEKHLYYYDSEVMFDTSIFHKEGAAILSQELSVVPRKSQSLV